MTRDQRRVHATIWTALGAILIAMLLIAMAARPQPIAAERAAESRP